MRNTRHNHHLHSHHPRYAGRYTIGRLGRREGRREGRRIEGQRIVYVASSWTRLMHAQQAGTPAQHAAPHPQLVPLICTWYVVKRAEGDGGGGGAEIVVYAVRGRCRNRIAILMRMTVIVTACSAFGLTVSETKTDIMCLQTKGGERCRSQSMQPARYTNNRVCVLGRGYHRRQRP